MERFQIYLTKEQREFIEWYGEENGIIAYTGRTTGKADKSAVIRLAINKLSNEVNDAQAQSESA